MCGIAGAFRFNNNVDGWADVPAMIRAVQHRGPDAEGDFRDSRVWLGHRRLSIIDLSSTANQPMADSSGRFQIVFNGELYNYREIRSRISDYAYRTNSDTEVILAAYQKWGAACLSHFAGMFSLAIWDAELQELFIARDRLGVKPLYYYRTDHGLVFASEIRALLASGLVPRRLNYAAVAGFFQFQSVGQPEAIVEGVCALDAGSYMVVSHHEFRLARYWEIGRHQVDFDFADGAAVRERVHSLLLQSVERRMVSDVPIAAFLSGGIDSSAVVALMAQLSAERVNTFTVGFKEKDFDESKYAAVIAEKFHTRHQLIKLKPDSFLDQLLPALEAMDTPSGDGVNSYVVSRAIRESGIIVALSGVGGDELFAGYPFFHQYLRLRKFRSLWKPTWPFRMALAGFLGGGNTKADRYKQLLRAPQCNIANFYPVFRQVISPALLDRLTKLPNISTSETGKMLEANHEMLEKLPLLSQVSIAEYLGYTRNTLLTDMDQTSMSVSLEVREPFFDHELIEFILNVPDEQKLGKYPKNLLVESFQGLLPLEVVDRKKQGFLFPWSVWMKNELRSFCEEHIQSMSRREFINRTALVDYWEQFQRGDRSIRWLEIWLFVVLEHWLNRNGFE